MDTNFHLKYDDLIYANDPRVRHLQIKYWNEIDDYMNEEINKKDPLIGEFAIESLVYLPTTTRESSDVIGRATDLIRSGKLFSLLSVSPFSAEKDRVMSCGSLAMNTDMKKICEEFGFVEGANSQPGHYVVEKAFVG